MKSELNGQADEYHDNIIQSYHGESTIIGAVYFPRIMVDMIHVVAHSN